MIKNVSSGAADSPPATCLALLFRSALNLSRQCLFKTPVNTVLINYNDSKDICATLFAKDGVYSLN